MDTTTAFAAGLVRSPDSGIVLFGRYRLEWRLGRGATSDVWCAYDLAAARRVTLKVLRPELCDSAPALARFEAEARVTDRLPAEQVLRVLGVESGADARALVFPYVPGETLDGVLGRGRLPAHEAASIARDVAVALASAHQAGIVHRDVKPGNILVEADGHARLLDFGIAKALEPAEGVATSAGFVIGTVRYLPPERLAGAPAGPATDVYQLGAVLYEMLAGVPAFDPGTGFSRTPPGPLADVPAPLMSICLDMMAVAPVARLHDAGVAAAVLDSWLSGGAASAAPAPGLSSDATTVIDGPSLGVSHQRVRPARARHARAVWVAAAAGLAIVAGFGGLATLPGSPPSAGLQGVAPIADAAAPTFRAAPAAELDPSPVPPARLAVARPPTSVTRIARRGPVQSVRPKQAKGNRGHGNQARDDRSGKSKGKNDGKDNSGPGHSRD